MNEMGRIVIAVVDEDEEVVASAEVRSRYVVSSPVRRMLYHP